LSFFSPEKYELNFDPHENKTVYARLLEIGRFYFNLIEIWPKKISKSDPNSPDCNKIENKFIILLQQVPASRQNIKGFLKKNYLHVWSIAKFS
jgi:hypothetical protein